MVTLSLDPHEYRNYVRMGSNCRILVEGRDDGRVFSLLLECLGVDRKRVDIDTAESLLASDDAVNNREKVELVCRLVDGQPYARKLAGFVDREYREFSDGDRPDDLRGKHFRHGRLVWSRGHSVENYLLDLQVVREPLRDFCASALYDDALDVFESVFESAITVACGIGLAGRDVGYQDLCRGSLEWEQFHVRVGELAFDVQRWRTRLLQQTGANSAVCERLVESFEGWREILGRSDPAVIRWMCDGHLGLKAVWRAYAASVHHVCKRAGVASARGYAARMLSGEETTRFNCCAAAWARRALGGLVTYPAEVLEMLGLEALIRST